MANGELSGNNGDEYDPGVLRPDLIEEINLIVDDDTFTNLKNTVHVVGELPSEEVIIGRTNFKSRSVPSMKLPPQIPDPENDRPMFDKTELRLLRIGGVSLFCFIVSEVVTDVNSGIGLYAGLVSGGAFTWFCYKRFGFNTYGRHERDNNDE